MPLFSPLALAHPIQTAVIGTISQFPFAVPPGATFVGQAIDNPDEFQEQVAYDRTTHLGKMGEQKENEGKHILVRKMIASTLQIFFPRLTSQNLR